MLINKFRKKNPSSSNNNRTSTSNLQDQELLGHHRSFQTYPLISKLHHPQQLSSLGHSRGIQQRQQHGNPYHSQPDNHQQLSTRSKSNNSSTVSFNSVDVPALSNSVQTSSSSSSTPPSSLSSSGRSSLLSSPTPVNQTVTSFNPPLDPHPAILNSRHQKARPVLPTPAPSACSTPTPRPTLAPATISPTTTTTTFAVAHPDVEFTRLAYDGHGDGPTILAPGGTKSSSPIQYQFDYPQQNQTPLQTFPTFTSSRHPSHSSSDGLVSLSSDAPPKDDQLGPPDNHIPIRPRALSHHTLASPNQSSFPQPINRSQKPASLFPTDLLERVPPATQHRGYHCFADTISTRSCQKTRRRRLLRSKTDNCKAVPGIASALALSAVSLTPHSTSVSLARNMQSFPSAPGCTRSPEDVDDRSVHTNDSRHWTRTASLSNDDQLGIGYAVASRKRNAEFHAIFQSIPDDDYLIEDYGCALQRDILVQGRIYISEQHVCFKANIFGWVTTLVIPFSDVAAVEKRMTALIIPNAIQVITTQSRHTFASFLTRDTVYDMINSVWRIAHPPGAEPSLSPNHDESNSSSGAPGDDVQVEYKDPSSSLSHPSTLIPPKKKEHPATQCSCSPETHCKELIWDATYPISPEKLYNILFQSDFLKDFWVNEEHLTEIEVGDWTTAPNARFPSRNVSYIRPVNAPVGPKAIKCILSDEHLALDFDKCVSVMSTTLTPDAPAGGGFCVKTLTCITWQPNNSSRWLVTAGVEWTKVNRFLKSIIESSAISGQKTYQAGVDRALRNHIQLYHVEPSFDRSETQAALAGNKSEEVLRHAHESNSARAPARNETNPREGTSPKLVNGSILKNRYQFQALSSGTQSSWMMMASIALAVILLVVNLMTVRREGQVITVGMGRTGSQGERSGYDGHRVKPHLTGDVAETVREALHQYFSDRPESASSINPEQPLKQSRLLSSPANQNELGTEPKKKPTFAAEEIAEIEILLESLEQRIRNVRKSLVEERRH